MTTVQPESVALKYQEKKDDNERSIDALHKRARDLMHELSRVESELGTVMVTIRNDANAVMTRATYEAHRKRDGRRVMYTSIFLSILIIAGFAGLISAAITHTCPRV